MGEIIEHPFLADLPDNDFLVIWIKFIYDEWLNGEKEWDKKEITVTIIFPANERDQDINDGRVWER